MQLRPHYISHTGSESLSQTMLSKPSTWGNNLPTSYKVAITLAGLACLTLGSLWLILSTNLYQLLDDQSNTFGRAIAKQSAYAGAELVLADDLLSLNVMATKLAEDANVESAIFFDSHGKILAKSSKLSTSQQTLIAPSKKSQTSQQLFDDIHQKNNTYAAPITFRDVFAGYAQITLNNDAVTLTIRHSIELMTATTITILICAIILALILSRNITRPIKSLTAAANAIALDDLDYRITERRTDEIGTLIRSFNTMAQGLKERHQLEKTFQQYVAPGFAKNILANLDQQGVPSTYVNASVLFIDIVGFTAMCEHLAPQEVEELLNEYYYHIVKSSQIYKGTVDKYIGDGAMVLFGAPSEDPNHRFNAICCAQLLLQVIAQINKKRAIENRPLAEFKLGIHSGEMLAGTLGSTEYFQYTVVGRAVNLASRLCDMGQAGKLLISKQVYNHASVQDKVIVSGQETLQVKGKSDPVEVYIVDQLRNEYQNKIEHQVRQLLARPLVKRRTA